jgi:hypothetical protein
MLGSAVARVEMKHAILSFCALLVLAGSGFAEKRLFLTMPRRALKPIFPPVA